MTTPISSSPFALAVLAALTAGLPGSYFVGDSEGPSVPAESVPYVVAYTSPGLVGGYPFAPARDLAGTVTLHGVGATAAQARESLRMGRDVLLAADFDGYVLVPDDADPPYPQRDDSLTPPLFVAAAVFDYSAL